MSSDVIWHIRDKLWPMPKHGSIRKVYACLAVTCHLHFPQNDRDFLRATVVTRGWNGYRNKSQHRKSTLEKKILPPFQQGFEPATFQSRVRCSNHWAIPAPPSDAYSRFCHIITIPASAGPENCGTCSDGPVIKATPSSSGCNSATCGPTLPSLYVEVRQHLPPPPPPHPTPYPHLPQTHQNNNNQQTNKKQCHPPTPTHDWQNSNPWHPFAQSEALNHLHCGGELVSFCLQH